jgi:two-component system chemotaxis response regulator CheY
MRGMNGLDVLTKLHELDGGARVVVVSADIQDSSREMAESGGASGFVTKPVERAAILKVIADVLGAKT